MIRGLVTGGFRPFHKGHEALIDYAKSHCDELVIFVADPPGWEIPYKYRLNWLSSQYLHDPQVEVFGDVVKEPEFGTNDEKSTYWGNFITEKFGKFDRVFTSESYGKVFSEALGAENWVFNTSRSIIPVSATMIRTKPLTNWEYINNFAKDYFVKKICIIGTESTGKTTLAEQLAGYYRTEWAHELGRDIVPSTRACTLDDIQLIGFKHAENILRKMRLANKVLFVDTDLKITKSYAEYLFKEKVEFAPWIEKANEMDLYIWLAQDTPYVDDGTRLPENERKELSDNHWHQYENWGENFHIINFPKGEKPYRERFNQVVDIIDNFMAKF